MSHAPAEVTPWVLDGGAVDIPCDEVITYWRAPDEACDVTLSDGSVVISARTTNDTAETVRADIQERAARGESTPVLASHLDALDLRTALLHWATG